VGTVGSARSKASRQRREEKEEKKNRLPLLVIALGWLVTTLIASGALWDSNKAYTAQQATYKAEKATEKLANEQSQQIAALLRTTPTGEITSIAAYRASGRLTTIANVRNNPFLHQQIYDLSGVVSDIPYNGALFMVVHDYGQPASSLSNPSNHYYVTPVTLSDKGNADQQWKASQVYIGQRSAPKTALSYRLTLYFCNSADTGKIMAAISSSAVQNFGLQSFPYPSCKQLDSIFVTRK